jgi:hypothetical protein
MLDLAVPAYRDGFSFLKVFTQGINGFAILTYIVFQPLCFSSIKMIVLPPSMIPEIYQQSNRLKVLTGEHHIVGLTGSFCFPTHLFSCSGNLYSVWNYKHSYINPSYNTFFIITRLSELIMN